MLSLSNLGIGGGEYQLAAAGTVILGLITIIIWSAVSGGGARISVTAIKGSVKPSAEAARARAREQRRQEELAATIPLQLYRLPRRTVTMAPVVCVLCIHACPDRVDRHQLHQDASQYLRVLRVLARPPVRLLPQLQ